MSSLHRTSWDGYYLDGQSPRRHAVSLTLTPDGVYIRRRDGSTLWWVFNQIRLGKSTRWGGPVLLENKHTLGEAVIVPEAEFFNSLRQFAPAGSFRSPAAAQLSSRLPLLLLAAFAAVVLGAALYIWGIPGLTRRAAAAVPTEWEGRLGDAALEQLAPPESRCKDAEQQRILDSIGETLMAAAPPSPYHLHLLIVDNPTANAFAVPGGRVVILRGLIERTDRAEELAGVLAHEIQHVLLRHPLQAVMRQLSLRALAAVLAGDSSGMASALGAAGTIGSLRYQRADEEAADRGAIRMLEAARVDPGGLIQMLEKLEQVQGDAPSPLQYLSNHPLTATRIAELKELAADSNQETVPLLPNTDWSRMRAACHANQGRHPKTGS